MSASSQKRLARRPGPSPPEPMHLALQAARMKALAIKNLDDVGVVLLLQLVQPEPIATAGALLNNEAPLSRQLHPQRIIQEVARPSYELVAALRLEREEAPTVDAKPQCGGVLGQFLALAGDGVHQHGVAVTLASLEEQRAMVGDLCTNACTANERIRRQASPMRPVGGCAFGGHGAAKTTEDLEPKGFIRKRGHTT